MLTMWKEWGMVDMGYLLNSEAVHSLLLLSKIIRVKANELC